MSSNPINKAVKAVWSLKKTVPLAGNLMIDPRVARSSKLIFVFVSLGYLLFPYDFIFDFPLFGQFDDLAVVVMMLNWFIRNTPAHILDEYGWDGKEVVLKKSKKQIAKEKARNKVIHKVTGIDLNAKAEARAQKKANKKSK
ncbi:MAG: DUF1232 domain-containing protein [Peptococcaceae bacterium]|nr:DUF1232 domain-containing protein [Peptococcaceae bacterium]MBO5139870.1 DUF1232 domain-containing protein [Peptococcaceae bacterium]MBO5302251.1 DUF1232 domain-containing protein [Peptococcaceae bacterium]